MAAERRHALMNAFKRRLPVIFIAAFIAAVFLASTTCAHAQSPGRTQDSAATGPASDSKDTAYPLDTELQTEEKYLLHPEFGPPEIPSNTCAVAHNVDPNTYRIVIGDRFKLNLIRVGHESNTYELTVLPEGKIMLPFIGEIRAQGMLLGEFTDKALAAYRRNFKDLQYSIQLSCLGIYEVMVVGAVKAPGVYLINSLTRLSTVIQKSRGWNPYGSLRNILIENGERSGTYDLMRFFNSADMSQNPFIAPDSIIRVPPIFGKVKVTGEVNAPGWYEIVEGDTVDSLAAYAYGFTGKADRDKTIVKRFIRSTEGKYAYERLDAYTAGPAGGAKRPGALADGDEVIVPSFADTKGGTVQALGAVRNPGTYNAYDGMTVTDLVYEAGGFTGLLAPDKADVFTTDAAGNPIRQTVHLPETPGSAPFTLKPGSRVYIYLSETKQRMVSIEGNVEEPGYYPYTEGLSVYDVINMAGGISYSRKKKQNTPRQAQQQAVDVVNPAGVVNLSGSYILRSSIREGQEEKLIPLRLDKLIFEQDMQQNVPLEPGDRIIIPDASDYVIVSGAVTEPGSYPFIGNLRAIHYASMAGLTSDADMNRITVQRASGELVGNPEALVNPGEVVIIYEKSSRRKERKFVVYSSMVSTLFLILNYINTQ